MDKISLSLLQIRYNIMVKKDKNDNSSGAHYTKIGIGDKITFPKNV